MANFVTQAELDTARKTLDNMSDEARYLLEEEMAEQRVERRAAFGGNGDLAEALVEETGLRISEVMFELCYKARINKLFEDRDNAQ